MVGCGENTSRCSGQRPLYLVADSWSGYVAVVAVMFWVGFCGLAFSIAEDFGLGLLRWKGPRLCECVKAVVGLERKLQASAGSGLEQSAVIL